MVVAAHSGESAYGGDALLQGDVIYAINTMPVSSVAILREAVEKLKDTEPAVLQVEREGTINVPDARDRLRKLSVFQMASACHAINSAAWTRQ